MAIDGKLFLAFTSRMAKFAIKSRLKKYQFVCNNSFVILAHVRQNERELKSQFLHSSIFFHISNARNGGERR